MLGERRISYSGGYLVIKVVVRCKPVFGHCLPRPGLATKGWSIFKEMDNFASLNTHRLVSW